ncbi:MAG TPA: beta-propeller fold lactonase family protein [Vicinamibacterales bacterium]|jgi:YVTN family beta-propeller protein|nr:beta-propeller fold lactonase family protein [Vicinamibacterales bacterium]
MNKRRLLVRVLAAAMLACPFLLSAAEWAGGSASAAAKKQKAQATRSSPIAITHDDDFVWSVNPDNDSVSVFRVLNDENIKVAEIPVGREPWCVAITPDDEKAYVTNMASGTVSVISTVSRQVVDTIRVGTEPFGCAITPDGKDLYVANQSSATISVINTRRDKVTETIEDVGVKPHGIAISANGKRVFVTQFLALQPEDDPRPLTQSEGADDGREGRVTVINANNNHVIGTIRLTPLADVGAAFRSDGNTLAREPLTGVFDNVSGAFPNLLESITIKDDLAYVPGTCSSPNGPFRFNVNVQSCLSTIDIDENTEAFKTLNMNVGVNFEPVGKKLFNTNPFAVAFKQSADEGFIALGATNRLLRVTLNDDGSATINPPLNANDPGNIIRIELKDPTEIGQNDPDDTIGGHNPRGLVLNSSDTRAYVMDFLSRDIAIVDVSGDDPTLYKTLARIQSADLPAAGSDAAISHRGKYLFNTAIGPEGSQPNSVRPSGRMSDTGWGTCYSCHPNALTDTVTWMFADGPRQAISMESTFEFGAAHIVNGVPALPDSHQRALNWSAVRDEVQDFTRNVRAVSGGGGLIRIDANGNPVPEGTAGLAQLPDLRPTANSGLNADLDAIATYLAIGVRAPISPIPSHNVRAELGRVIFEVQGCQNCHGGKNWTISALDYTPPPAANEVVDVQLVRFLCRVGTFDASLFIDGVSNEIRANAAANIQARGALGINVPSLISVFASAPYLHSGAAASLDDVLGNVTHRTAGRADHLDFLGVPLFRRLLVQFLSSIDRDTPPILNVTPPLDACGPQ